MAADLGKVGIVMKGDYNSANVYEVLDAVSYNGGLYIAKQDTPAGTTPTNTTYWQQAAVPTDITTKNIITFSPESGITVTESNCYSIAGGFICVRLGLKADTAITSRTLIGTFVDMGTTHVVAVVGVMATVPDSYIDGLINGFINMSNQLMLGDYVSNPSGARDISIDIVFHA